MVTAGLGLIGLGLLGASTAGPHTPYGVYVLWLLVVSFGIGACMPALTIGVVTSLPQHQAGLGSGLGTASRELGAALGVAVAGTVLGSAHDFTGGMSSALRWAGALVVASSLPVALGYRGRTAEGA